MTMKRIPLAREGWPFVAVPAALAAGLFVSRRRRLALPFAAAGLRISGAAIGHDAFAAAAGCSSMRCSAPGHVVP